MTIKQIIIGPLGWDQTLFANYQLQANVTTFTYTGQPAKEIQQLVNLIMNERVVVYAFSFGGLILQAALNRNQQIAGNIEKVYYYDALERPTSAALAGILMRRESYVRTEEIINDYLSPDEENTEKKSLVLSQFIKTDESYTHKYSNQFMHTYLEYIIEQNLQYNFNYDYKIYTVNYIAEAAREKQQLIKPAEHLMMIENEEQVLADLNEYRE